MWAIGLVWDEVYGTILQRGIRIRKLASGAQQVVAFVLRRRLRDALEAWISVEVRLSVRRGTGLGGG